MEMRSLGHTGLTVSAVGLGGLFLPSAMSGRAARDVLAAGVEAGIRYVDTAPSYGESEALVGQALADIREPLVVSTKLGGRPLPFDPRSASGLRASALESLRLLGRDVIDVLMVHEPDRPAQVDWWTDPSRCEGPVMDVLEDLRSEGLVRAIGIGGTTAWELARVVRTGRFDVVLTAFNYSLLWREAALSVFPAARETGTAVVVGSPLQQGAFARRWDDEVASATWLSEPRRRQFLALYDLADRYGIEMPELALRFVLSEPLVSSVLVGARSAEEIAAAANAAALGPLDDDVMEELDLISAQVPFRPFEEPPIPPFGRPYVGPGPLV